MTACTDPNPWDSSMRCVKPRAHGGLHEINPDTVYQERWADHCHYDGDACGTGVHPTETEEN